MLNKPIRQSLLYNAMAMVQDRQISNSSTKEINSDINTLTGKVLLVDDNVINQHVGIEMLSKLGLQCEKASNGLEAFEARKTGDFDVILMDCQMPVMDGFEATRQIRLFENESSKPKVNIIALTANAMAGDREKCLDVGMNDYLSKPYTMQELFDVLAQSLPSISSSKDKRAIVSMEEQLIENKESEPQTDIINTVKFEETKVLMGDSFGQIMDAFIESGTKNIAEMNEHLVAENFEELRGAAHALKGSSAMLGIQALSEICRKVEDQCRLGEINNISEQVETINLLFEKSLQHVEHLLAQEETA
jgi:CheY-like chemotaxis protein/HPt (histidine-containing phosphotransfer) domain-containing protein